MSANTEAGTTATTERGTGQLLYGLVPSDVELTDQVEGLGDPLGPVTVIRHGDVAALVSEMPLDVRLGRPADLMAYQKLLDATAVAGEVPVLPVRFGTVLASREAVTELLASQHDRYREVLEGLTGRVEYLVRARYVEQALLAEVLAEQPEAAALREQLRDLPAEANVNLRIRLGELVHQAVEAKRASDTARIVDALAGSALANAPQPPTHEQDAARVAFLVERSRGAEFEEAAAVLADEWRDRVTVRLLGPSAPWDFVTTPQPAG
ncbi:GvpL/GvpF family gas vesicle protein [Phytohabitans kaempferiae]|uniref:GvpL/GvpF family gas vesicle protein n=1 Tax=Phytohabitans kaempferiae TaxID=1620943 RepID=A0ABV6MH70_9ACTN